MKFHGKIVCTCENRGTEAPSCFFSPPPPSDNGVRCGDGERKRGEERELINVAQSTRRSDGNNSENKTEINFSQCFVAFRRTAVAELVRFFFSPDCDSLNASVLPYHMCIKIFALACLQNVVLLRMLFIVCRSLFFWKQRDATQNGNAMRRNATQNAVIHVVVVVVVVVIVCFHFSLVSPVIFSCI